MTDATWPEDYQERARELLPSELSHLSCELKLYLDLSPVEPPNGRVVYTAELSNIHVRIGRATLFAEIAIDTKVQHVLNRLTESLTTLINNLNYTRSLSDVSSIHNELIAILADMKNKVTPVVSVGSYRIK